MSSSAETQSDICQWRLFRLASDAAYRRARACQPAYLLFTARSSSTGERVAVTGPGPVAGCRWAWDRVREHRLLFLTCGTLDSGLWILDSGHAG